MVLAVGMVVIGYIIPLAVAIGATDVDQHEWKDGYLSRVTSDVVGPWLGAWTVFAAGISNIALFQAELSADGKSGLLYEESHSMWPPSQFRIFPLFDAAFQLMGMADRGHLPKLFSTRSRHGTPTYGILVGVAVIVVMGVSDLGQLIEMLNFNYALALLLEYAAFIKLRISRPELDRPYRVPLNTFGCLVIFTPPVFFTVAILCMADYATLVFCFFVNMLGLIIFVAKQRSEYLHVDDNYRGQTLVPSDEDDCDSVAQASTTPSDDNEPSDNHHSPPHHSKMGTIT
jgi:amino acid transporter